MNEPSAEPRRGPGRKPKPVTILALRAAAAILAESGYAAFTIDQVAERAGLGRATIYRRWPTKLQLVADMLRTMADDFVIPQEDSLRADLLAVIAGASTTELLPAERVLGTLISEAFQNRELAGVVRSEYLARTWTIVSEMFDRAIARGEVRREVDVGLLVHIAWGFIWQRRFINRLMIDDAAAAAFVDTLLNGLRVAPA
jgi:AcrR family transcriptional regulator